MVLRINKFDDPTQNKVNIPIDISFFGRGSRWGGDCSLSYQATRKGGRWTVEYQGFPYFRRPSALRFDR
jgi:hypothetical protein